MANDLDPIVGNWYRKVDDGNMFRVVEVDEDQGTVTVQHFDGDLEEMEEDAWFELDLELTDEPEDWTGPMDDVERDDLGYSEPEEDQRDWDAPVRGKRRAAKEDWEEEDEDDDERDDWDEEADEDLYG